MRIEWTDRAQWDVNQIYSYISVDSEPAARRVVQGIRQAVDGLAIYPHVGRPGRLPRYRELVVDQYVIVYVVRRELILIVRVWHSARRR